MEVRLLLYSYVDGGLNDTPFPNTDNQIEITAFRYDAKRMGSAPIISASVMYDTCLDELWSDSVYAEFNGEKYFLKQTPTSSYSSQDSRYKHDIELISERSILDNVYFYDVVIGSPQEGDTPASNGTNFVFWGDIHEFANRLAASLEYSGVDYQVQVDANVVSEEKMVSFQDAFFSSAIQEAYNTYNVPYYFDGKTLHFGKGTSDIESVFRYGVDDSLLSITKTNANYKVVNRVTGVGSTDNIPFYYPNMSPRGDIEASLLVSDDSNLSVTIIDVDKYINNIEVGGIIEYKSLYAQITSITDEYGNVLIQGNDYHSNTTSTYRGFKLKYYINITSYIDGESSILLKPVYDITRYQNSEDEEGIPATYNLTARLFIDDQQVAKSDITTAGKVFNIKLKEGSNVVVLSIDYSPVSNSSTNIFRGSHGLRWGIDNSSYGWFYNDKQVEPYDIGLRIEGYPVQNDCIKQVITSYTHPSKNLMPSIYRDTLGANRFYNATNGTYIDDNGTPIVFPNPYIAGRPREHIVNFEDIKPTIAGATVNGLRIDMFSEFAYDIDDNDETYEDEEGNTYFRHPYFFGKLRRLGFNLFDHAIENQPMTISFTTGHCGACSFEIGVTEEYPQKNPVQVDIYGNLVYDDNGMVLCGCEGTDQLIQEYQDSQQDTINNEVWIALRKEEDTYGILMPKVEYRPKACTENANNGDTFVILGINLPNQYITSAEALLTKELIKYMLENNVEKFTFSITFSRIYFEEHPEVLALLNENSNINIEYNGHTYNLYVTSFSYSITENDSLPQITVELNEVLTITQNALQNAISEVKLNIRNIVGETNDALATQQNAYISKKANDVAKGIINFEKGIKFSEGGKIEVTEDNSAKLTIDYLEVTKKATFTSLEIQEKTHVGGQVLITPAAINCGEVEELNTVYRCYFQTKGQGGDEIFNTFEINDQAICQSFNEWENKYYWRLVVNKGEDYIDLSKSDCDEGSGVPSAGDKIILLGNRYDVNRQNAIILAAYGDGSPYIIQYKGINNYTLPSTDSNDGRITTLLSPNKNILTGIIDMMPGSKGLESFAEWAATKELIDSKASTENLEKFGETIQNSLNELQKQIDGAIETWFYEGVPTLTNLPASEWTTDEIKNVHLGDLYYDDATGKAYRFQMEGDNYIWHEITDTDIQAALAAASKAQDAADGKRRVFVAQPTTPYDEGDLWVNATYGDLYTNDILRCKNTKDIGTQFSIEDWELASKYTDDSKAEEALRSIAGYEYLKDALKGNTTIIGGLILSQLISLGYTDDNDVYHTMSGINGVYNASAKGGGIAAWYGGGMVDAEDGSGAQSLFRFDGSGYLSGGNIKWDKDGAGSVAGGDLSWDKEGNITLATGIKISADGDETLGTILTSLQSKLDKTGGEIDGSLHVRGVLSTSALKLPTSTPIVDDSEGYYLYVGSLGTGATVPSDGGGLSQVFINVNGSTHESDIYGNVTLPDYPLLSTFTALQENVNTLLYGNGEFNGVIDTWEEMKAFLVGIPDEGATLLEMFTDLDLLEDAGDENTLSVYNEETQQEEGLETYKLIKKHYLPIHGSKGVQLKIKSTTSKRVNISLKVDEDTFGFDEEGRLQLLQVDGGSFVVDDSQIPNIKFL